MTSTNEERFRKISIKSLKCLNDNYFHNCNMRVFLHIVCFSLPVFQVNYYANLT